MREAQAALDAARPAVARLDGSRDPEDLAADLLESWEGVERALRALCGTPTLSGQSLIREARQRQILTLDQAHALVEFSASCEKARETSYAPTWTDIQNAQVAFKHMESLLLQSTVHSAPIQTPSRNEVQPGPGLTPKPVAEARLAPPRPNILGRVLVAVAILALLGAGGFFAWQYFMSADAAMRKGVAAFAAGRRSEASHQFDIASERDPRMALPHVYAGRIYREDGNLESASIELTKAIELEPQNAVALREMGSYLLAKGDFDLARAFYVRALTVDQNDRLAMGYLACALTRLNRFEEAQRFLQRAGPGAWSSCATPPAQIPAPLPR
ncbi:MAG: tetratricopeptide repeat protein [Gemmatimonadaceae bacterium]